MFEFVPSNSPDFLLASFLYQGTRQPDLVILTGSSGSGKTRWCQTFIQRALTRRLSLAGLLSPAVFQKSEKVGIDLVDLASGQQRRLAIRTEAAGSNNLSLLPTKNSHWNIDPTTIAWGNTVLAGLDRPPFLVIDELGPLEFERGLGFIAGLELLDSQRHGFAIVVIRPSLLSRARERWPWAKLLDLQQPEAAK